MRTPAFSPLHAAAGRFVPCALTHFNPSAVGRAKVRHGAHVGLPDVVLQMAGGDAFVASPVPPSRENRPGAFGRALEARGPHRFSQWGGTGSAENPWKSVFGFAKCLIHQANPPTSCPRFSTGCARFSTGRVSAVRPAAPSFSPSKSLKEKKKEQGERQAGRAQWHPRVEGVFPRVRTPAYFLIHGFHGSGRPDLWKFVEEKTLRINRLGSYWRASTGPQVALRVVPSRAGKRGRS
ncbi:hypothetical protein R11007_04232 [Ralstonia holmesii]|nr:hypothetical protein R11007_04232 [Ralstonia sp. LMG 32967]